jgi:hypothetical protein
MRGVLGWALGDGPGLGLGSGLYAGLWAVGCGLGSGLFALGWALGLGHGSELWALGWALGYGPWVRSSLFSPIRRAFTTAVPKSGVQFTVTYTSCAASCSALLS